MRQTVMVRYPVYAQVGTPEHRLDNIPFAALTQDYERYPDAKLHLEVDQHAFYVFVEYTRLETDAEYQRRTYVVTRRRNKKQ